MPLGIIDPAGSDDDDATIGQVLGNLQHLRRGEHGPGGRSEHRNAEVRGWLGKLNDAIDRGKQKGK